MTQEKDDQTRKEDDRSRNRQDAPGVVFPGRKQGRNAPDSPAHKPPTSAQQAAKDGRSAQPGADADDLDSQDRIPDLRR